MQVRTPDYFRERAQDALTMARRAKDSDQKQAFEKIAAGYLALAENAERHVVRPHAPGSEESSSG